METIAVLGLGRMGQGIAICLIRRGYRVASPQVVRYARRMAERNYADHPAFTLGLRLKDANYGMLLANRVGSPALLGEVATSLFAMASEGCQLR